MENTAKNFALQLGSLVSLYVSIVALITLVFSIITIKYPDAAQGYWEIESAAMSIRFGLALLIVFFPTYIILTRLVNTIRRVEHGTYLTLTKWLIYLSLLVGGATILGDLVAVINSFLNGELTIRFILKAVAFFVVIGTAFTYYIFDARGYWQEHEQRSIQYAIGVTAVVIATLIAGFMHTETPTQVREQSLDVKQISDLSMIQSQIETYYQTNAMLPETLSDAYAGLESPTAPEERAAYEYRIIDTTTFELCATFAYETSKTEQMQYAQPMYTVGEGAFIKNPTNWNHGVGHVCFKRLMNPSTTLKP